MAKTIEFAKCNDYKAIAKFFADEYVFWGPIFGPITADNVKKTQKGFNIQDAYPHLQIHPFGFTIDPDNPYCCYFFDEHWEGTNTQPVMIGRMGELPPTNTEVSD